MNVLRALKDAGYVVEDVSERWRRLDAPTDRPVYER